jgi:hypothetical protein
VSVLDRLRSGLSTTPGRVAAGGLAVAVVAAGIGIAAVASAPPAPVPSADPSPSPIAAASPDPTVWWGGPGVPSPTPRASSPLAFEHLSGIPTEPELAGRYPMAVMIDDSPAARPQAGLSAASVVWQAPAEGGIPRYMAMYQSGEPPSIGPVRSARLYFVQWAAEWRSVYLHAGGPPPLKAWLASGRAPVLDVNGRATRRMTFRAAPHNLYTEGKRLRAFAARTLDATPDNLAYDPTAPGALQPFREPAPLALRGDDGGTIRVTYTSERVDYRFDRGSGTWQRSVDGRPQRDALATANGGRGAAADGPAIAPTTVVVMIVPIRRSSSIEDALGRLEADSIGSGEAWMFVDGQVVAGRWSKGSDTARTRFLDAAGDEVAFPRGQVFVQVVPARSSFSYSVPPAP